MASFHNRNGEASRFRARTGNRMRSPTRHTDLCILDGIYEPVGARHRNAITHELCCPSSTPANRRISREKSFLIPEFKFELYMDYSFL